MTAEEIMLNRLNELITEGENLLQSLNERCVNVEGAIGFPNYYDGDDLVQFLRWKRSCLQLLKRLYGWDETLKSLEEDNERNRHKLRQILAVIESARDEVERGLIRELRKAVADDLFGSIFDGARILFAEGFIPGAAVYCRVALEQGLRECADRNNIEWTRETKISTLLDQLKKEQVLERSRWRKAQYWLDIGNFFAHPQPEDAKPPSDRDVERMIDDMEPFLKELS